MRIKRSIPAVVMLAVVLPGCATSPSYQARAGNQSEAANVRRLTLAGFIDQTIAELEKVDGSPCPGVSDYVLVDAGLRTLDVVGNRYGVFGARDRGRAELKVTAKAGHTYLIRVELNGRTMTFWTEDADTHEATSERQSTTTTHWINWL